MTNNVNSDIIYSMVLSISGILYKSLLDGYLVRLIITTTKCLCSNGGVQL
jgi:hypothetical protein